MYQAACDLQTSPHPAGQGFGLCRAPLGEVDKLQQFLNRRFPLLRGNVVELRIDVQVLFNGEIKIAGEGLGNDAKQTAGRIRLFLYIVTRDACFPGSDRNERRHHTNQSRFAGAIGAEQTENLLVLNLERNIVYGGEIAVFLDDVLHLDRVRGGFAAAVTPVCGRAARTSVSLQIANHGPSPQTDSLAQSL